MGFMGGICAFAGIMLADGYGWPTTEFVVLGVLLGSIFAGLVVKNVRGGMNRAIRRVLLLAAIFLVSMGLAHYSVRVDPRVAFGKALGTGVPSGVSGLHAWQQFFDGQIYVFSFNANQQAINSILAAPGFKYEQDDYGSQRLRDATPQELQGLLSVVLFVPNFDVERLQVTKFSQPQVWRFTWNKTGSDEQVILIWDPPAQRAFVSRYWG